jgi:hypothetical protein
MPFGKVVVQDGLIVHQKLYMSQSEALEAVGLFGARRSRRLLLTCGILRGRCRRKTWRL